MPPTPPDPSDLLLHHARWLRSLAQHLVSDPSLADDLVHDTYLAALQHPPRPNPNPNPNPNPPSRPWLRTVLHNAARQTFRSRARRHDREQQHTPLPPPTTPDETAERIDTERQLTDELARLEEPYRTTLVLRFYDGLEPTRIAQRLDLPPGTVRWRIHRGLEILRQRLDRRFGERPTWCALLLPLAAGRELTATGLASGASLLPGVLAMNALSKTALGAVALVAIAVTLGVTGVLPDPLAPFRGEAPAALAVRPYSPPSEPAAHAPSPPSAERAPAPSRATPPPAPAPPPVDAASPSFVEARAVDSDGRAIPGVRLLELGSQRSSRGTADGRVELELEGTITRYAAHFELGARGFASLGLDAVIQPGERVSLGTLVLLPGGAVSGRVVDPDGVPVAGARVSAGEADLPRRMLEAQRLHPDERLVPSTTSDPDGRFTLDRLPAGRVRLWATAPGRLAGYSAPVDVAANEEAYGLELVLESMRPENRVLVAVVDPGGAPVARARLEFRHASRTTGTTHAGEASADADGHHEFVVPEDARLSVTAHDPDERYGPASASDLRPGPGTTVLRLSAASSIALRVLDAAGAPIERYGFAFLSTDGTIEHLVSARVERPSGEAEGRAPASDFLLRVDAPGYELAELGPFPASTAEPIEVVLAPVPGIHGRVLAGERPLAGARVRLHPRVEPHLRYEKDGFVALWRTEATDEVESDADGRFLLTVRASGEYAVRADARGHAPAVLEGVRVGAGLSAPELTLQVSAGGAIEGYVVAAPGEDPAGTIVGLSRGDGYDRTLRAGPDGGYRFERLTPGPWRLSVAAEEIQPNRTTTTTSDVRRPVEIEWTCTVREGETSRCDLVLGDAEACALEGRLAIDGAPPGAWLAWLAPEGELFETEPARVATLDPEGRFRVAASEPGAYQLAIASSLAGPEMRMVLDVVRLREGEAEWERNLETGTLAIAGAPAWDGEGVPGALHLWSGPGELQVLTVIAAPETGELRVAVPAGPARIVRPEQETLDFDRWATLVEIDVPRGGEALARLP